MQMIASVVLPDLVEPRTHVISSRTPFRRFPVSTVPALFIYQNFAGSISWPFGQVIRRNMRRSFNPMFPLHAFQVLLPGRDVFFGLDLHFLRLVVQDHEVAIHKVEPV